MLVERFLAHTRTALHRVRSPIISGVQPAWNRASASARNASVKRRGAGALGLCLRLLVRCFGRQPRRPRLRTNSRDLLLVARPQSPPHLPQSFAFLTLTADRHTLFLGHALAGHFVLLAWLWKNVADRATFLNNRCYNSRLHAGLESRPRQARPPRRADLRCGPFMARLRRSH
jgi:hypothetical protein